MARNLMILGLLTTFSTALPGLAAGLSLAAKGSRPTLAVGRTVTAPAIDGDLTEAAWAEAASVPLFCDFQTGRPAPSQTQMLAAWNDEHLFLAFRCNEPRMADLRATLRERDAGIWGEDCVEVFLRPNGTGPYYHFIVNPLGTLYDEVGQSASWNSGAPAAARRGAAEWTCELALPWRDLSLRSKAGLGGPPAVGTAWTGNFTRTRRPPGEELSCWSVTGGSFHNTEAFGQLLFVEAAPSLRAVSFGHTLPGVNLFQADVTLPATTPRPVSVILSTLAGPRVLLQATLPAPPSEGGERGGASAPTSQAVAERYDLAPDDLKAPLEVTLEGPDTLFYRQRIALDVPVAPSLADVRAAVEKLGNWEIRKPGPDSPVADTQTPRHPDTQTLRQQGEGLLQDLDAALEAARQKGTSLSQAEWETLVQSLTAFQRQVLRPVVWTAEPTSTVQPDTLPPFVVRHESAVSGDATGVADYEPSVDVALAQNERESIAVRLNNAFYPHGLDLRLSVTDPKSVPTATPPGPPFQREEEVGVPLSRTHLTLREAIPVPTRAGGVIVDPLSPLPPAGIVHLPPGETREVWVTVDAEGVAPGYYLGELTLEPLDPRTGVQTTTLPLRVRVWPIELSRQMPVSVFTCDYGRSARSPAHLEDLILHHTNVFNTNGMPDAGDGQFDLDRLGEHLQLVRGKGLLFLEVWFMRATGWRPEYERWVRDAAKSMEALGFSYKDWVLHIYDETLCDEFLECAKQIKAIEPRLQIFTDCMGTPEQIRAFAPYVDFWCPHCGALTNEAGLAAMRATGKPLWTYECGSVKDLPVGRYRALPWRAWRYQLDGIFFWCYPGSVWNELPLEGFNYGHIYEGYRGEPVSSKRWEAWSDGLEDYLLLRAYGDRLGQTSAVTNPQSAIRNPPGESANNANRREFLTLIGENSRKLADQSPKSEIRNPKSDDEALLAEAQAVGDRNGGDPAEMTALRQRIAHRLLELQGTPIAQDFPRLSFPLWPWRAAGDGQGTVQVEPGGHTDAGDFAMVVRSPTEKSWTFLIQGLPARPGDRVQFSLWVRGRGVLRVGVSEGFHFGGDPAGHRITEQYLPLRDDWQEVRLEHEVQATPVEAVVGFDYGQADGVAVLSDGEVVVQPEGEK